MILFVRLLDFKAQQLQNSGKVTITEDMISFGVDEFVNARGETIPVNIAYNDINCIVEIFISPDTNNLKAYKTSETITDYFGETIYLCDGFWYSDLTKEFDPSLTYESLEENIIKLGAKQDDFYFVIQLEDEVASLVDLSNLEADYSYTASSEEDYKYIGANKIEIYKDKNYLACYNNDEVVVYYYEYDESGSITLFGLTIILNSDGTFTVKK